MVARKNTTDVAELSTEVVPTELVIGDELAASFNSWDDLESYFGSEAVNIGDVAGDGYELIRQKDILVNIPFFILDWKLVTDPDSMRDYATIRVITADGRRIRFSGGTAILETLQLIKTKTGKTGGIRVKGGLVKSEYYINPESGEPIKDLDKYKGPKEKAATYYLNQS